MNYPSDHETRANDRVSPVARNWHQGLWSSIRTANELSGVSLDKINNLISQGRIRVERINGQTRVAVEDLVAATAGEGVK